MSHDYLNMGSTTGKGTLQHNVNNKDQDYMHTCSSIAPEKTFFNQIVKTFFLISH